MMRSPLVIEIFFLSLSPYVWSLSKPTTKKTLDFWEIFLFFEIICHMKDLTRPMIQPTWLPHQYLPDIVLQRFHSNFPSTKRFSNNSQNWIGWRRTPFDLITFGSEKLEFFNSLLHHFDLMYDLDLKKFLIGFHFLSCIIFERELSCSNVGLTCMIF